MNNIKLLATLFIGIFIGYIMTNLTASYTESVACSSIENHAHDAKMPVKKPDLASEDNLQGDTNMAPTLVNQTEASGTDLTEMSISSQNNDKDDYQKLEQAYLESTRKISSLQRKLDEFDDSDISTEQMEALVVEPFKSNIGSFSGVERNNIYNFHQTDDDADWGYNMQNYISDFVLTHYDADGINLTSVLCKQQQCELLVIQQVEGAWQNIFQELSQQVWWKFHSSTSTSGNVAASKGDLAIYTFLSL